MSRVGGSDRQVGTRPGVSCEDLCSVWRWRMRCMTTRSLTLVRRRRREMSVPIPHEQATFLETGGKVLPCSLEHDRVVAPPRLRIVRWHAHGVSRQERAVYTALNPAATVRKVVPSVRKLPGNGAVARMVVLRRLQNPRALPVPRCASSLSLARDRGDELSRRLRLDRPAIHRLQPFQADTIIPPCGRVFHEPVRQTPLIGLSRLCETSMQARDAGLGRTHPARRYPPATTGPDTTFRVEPVGVVRASLTVELALQTTQLPWGRYSIT